MSEKNSPAGPWQVSGGESISQPPLNATVVPRSAFHVIPRGFAGPSLLAMILSEKYGVHQPLNRQSERYAKAFDYMLRRWDGFARFLEDGRVCSTNNAAERALRGLALLGSLCILLSSVCKHWKRVVVDGATRAAFSGNRSFDAIGLEI
jgi:hypothetical protein